MGAQKANSPKVELNPWGSQENQKSLTHLMHWFNDKTYLRVNDGRSMGYDGGPHMESPVNALGMLN